jgi:hypothetical protein
MNSIAVYFSFYQTNPLPRNVLEDAEKTLKEVQEEKKSR